MWDTTAYQNKEAEGSSMKSLRPEKAERMIFTRTPDGDFNY